MRNIVDIVEIYDGYDKLFDDWKCICNDDIVFFMWLDVSDLKKVGCVLIGEDECCIC